MYVCVDFQRICENVSFNKMKSNPAVLSVHTRKGIVGDWKEHFTPELQHEIDSLYEDKLKDSSLKDLFVQWWVVSHYELENDPLSIQGPVQLIQSMISEDHFIECSSLKDVFVQWRVVYYHEMETDQQAMQWPIELIKSKTTSAICQTLPFPWQIWHLRHMPCRMAIRNHST